MWEKIVKYPLFIGLILLNSCQPSYLDLGEINAPEFIKEVLAKAPAKGEILMDGGSGFILDKFPEEILKFEGKDKITKISLKLNDFKEIPAGIKDFKNLEILDLSISQFLVKIPPEIGELTNLKELTINGITTELPSDINILPSEIGNLKKLEKLNLNYNKLKILPDNFTSLESLKILDLSGNQLENLPVSFGDLVNLEQLNLSYNKLTTLPVSINKLQKLSVLELAKNQIQVLPDEISDLTNLGSLNLENNQLQTLPEEINKLNKLHYLFLKGNNFSKSEQQKIKDKFKNQNIKIDF